MEVVGVGVEEADGGAPGERLAVGVPLGVTVGVPVPLPVGVAVEEGVGVALGVGVAVRLPVPLPLLGQVAEAEDVGQDVPVANPVPVGLWEEGTVREDAGVLRAVADACALPLPSAAEAEGLLVAQDEGLWNAVTVAMTLSREEAVEEREVIKDCEP